MNQNRGGGGGGGNQNKGGFPKAVNDLLAATPGALFELVDRTGWDLEKLYKAFRDGKKDGDKINEKAIQTAFEADKQTFAGIPIVVDQTIIPAMESKSTDFPNIAQYRDEFLEVFRAAQKEKKKQYDQKQEDAEEKRKKQKEDSKKEKSDPSAAIRKVHAIANGLPHTTQYPKLQHRWQILLFGEVVDGELEAVGFFDALAKKYSPKEVTSFYEILGKGSDEEIRATLKSLLALRNAETMVENLLDRNLIKPDKSEV